MIFPRREEASNKDLILTIIEIQGYLSRYGKLHTNWHETLNEVVARLEQEPKTGHWIYDYISADGHRTYHCSECGCYLQPKHSEPLSSFKWCSLCGAKMVEPQESEE